MLALGFDCCCDGVCLWCDPLSFASRKALITPYGITPGTGIIGLCCDNFDSFTYATDLNGQIDAGDPTTSPWCPFDNAATVTPTCYYRLGPFATCGTFTGFSCFMEIRFYVYQAGADLRGAVYFQVWELNIPVNTIYHEANAMADFLISAGATSTDCMAFTLTAQALTVCSTVGTLEGCSLPTTFDLAMAAA